MSIHNAVEKHNYGQIIVCIYILAHEGLKRMLLDNFLQCCYMFIEYLVTIIINTWVNSNENNYPRKMSWEGLHILAHCLI